MSNIIAELEAEQMKREVPEFSPGDTVGVQVKIKEGDRERLQAFEGVVIAKRNRSPCVKSPMVKESSALFRPIAPASIVSR